MGGLFGGGKSTSTTAERLVSIALQTSAYGGVIPILFGTDRVPANVIDYDDFTAIPHTTTQKVGKGGGGSSQSSTTYTYTAMVILALCEGGSGLTINRVWRDKDLGSVSGFGFTFFPGVRPATAWSYLTSKHPTKALGYAGTAILASAAVDLGESATLKNHSFEVTGYLPIASGPGAGDSHPADFIPAFLTSTTYGCFWAASRVDSLATFRTYCTACGFWLSPFLNEQRSAADWLGEWLMATNSEAVWAQSSTGMILKIIPYGDTVVTGNGATYTPNTTPIYDLGHDDFLTDSPDDDPVKVTRRSPADSFNVVPIQFKDRALSYNDNTLDDPEQVDVDTFGERTHDVITLNCIKRAAVALAISRILAQRFVYCRNEYTFRLGWRYVLLEPMDLVTLTEPKIGFDHKVVRIKTIEENDNGDLTLVAEEWPFGVASATLYTTQTGDGTAPNVNADPGNANTPVIFNVPSLLQEGTDPEVMVAASGGPLWGGCEVWVSSDNATYAYAGSITAPARHGTLTALLGSSATQADSTNTCEVDLAVSKGTLQSVPAQTAIDLLNACWVEGEVLAFQTATLTAANRYNLTTLRRGAYGTSLTSKASGSRFVRLDAAPFRYAVPASRMGQTLYVKLVSTNIWGGGKQDISTLTPYTFTPTAQTLPQPSSVTIAVSTTRPS